VVEVSERPEDDPAAPGGAAAVVAVRCVPSATLSIGVTRAPAKGVAHARSVAPRRAAGAAADSPYYLTLAAPDDYPALERSNAEASRDGVALPLTATIGRWLVDESPAGRGFSRVARVRLALLVVVVAALALALASLAGAVARAPLELLVVVQPAPDHADAVAVLGGGGATADRERVAVALWRDGRADHIVALGGPLPLGDPDVYYAWAVRRRLIAAGASPEAVRILAVGSSTAGELTALRAAAEAEGWTSLVVATSRLHSRRAALLAEQAFGGSPIAWRVVVAPEPGPSIDRWWDQPDLRAQVLGEWLKIALALALPTEPP
jgi:uncharacterized SAM-binding protein YcdF (DUF218 family)